MAHPLQLFIIDPYTIVRSGLRTLLTGEPDITCIGEAASGREALHQLTYLRPDLVVMELIDPGADGLATLRRLRTQRPDCQVLVFTERTDDHTIWGAMEAGAIGYLPKTVAASDLIRAVRAVAQGEPALHATAQRVLLQAVLEAPLLPALTAREQEVLGLITQGKRNRDIANTLCLTEGTVKGYVSTILNKLDVHDRTAAAMFAVKHRLAPAL
ncbi:MAG: response regulator transcription factor [Caldilineaceae bacterium]